MTGSADPDGEPTIPDDVREALKTSANRRDDIQSVLVNNFYRSISPSLEPVRKRLAELKSRTSPVPLVVARNRQAFIPVPVGRSEDFKGEVTVSLEGFSSGRDPATKMPTPTLKNLVAAPLAIKPDDAFGRLTFRVSGTSETGTRMVVIKAESKIGNDTYVQYSPAFPLTVTEK